MKNDFMKQYVNQRHLRRAFFEEYKIHSFNFILLLFESCIRIQTTLAAQRADQTEGEDGIKNEAAAHYYSKNYRRFLEHRQKKLDKFNINCIGWNHVQRIVEVIEMSIRDLVFKIVPAKVIVRELKTSTGKVLTKDTEYVLIEKKKNVTQGKNVTVQYYFELDIKEDSQTAKDQKHQQSTKEDQTNPFFVDLECFSTFKLRSAIFLVDFPVNFAIRILSIWMKIIPFQATIAEGYSREDLQLIGATKIAIRDFSSNIVTHLQHLVDYLKSVKQETPLKANFKHILKDPVFQEFKSTMLAGKSVFLIP